MRGRILLLRITERKVEVEKRLFLKKEMKRILALKLPNVIQKENCTG
jgi:hypothetical protein